MPRPLPAISPYPTSPDGHKVSPRRLKTDTGPIYPNRARTIASLCPSSPILLLQRHTFGGFGLSGDNLLYTFTLRDGLTFHNGDAVTAAAVVPSINR